MISFTWALTLVSLIYISWMPLSLSAQLWIAIALIVAMSLLRTLASDDRTGSTGFWGIVRVLILGMGAVVTLRYFFWRTFNTIAYHDVASMAAALSLYAAECYGVAMYFLGMFVNIRPLQREMVPIRGNPSQWPTVDILVPTYDEDPALLKITLLGATQIRYPAEKLRVYLLDDGGTRDKLQSADAQVAELAAKRQHELQLLCKETGAEYVTRERNEYAKAGNINAALKNTNGELILILDADHVPTVDILEQTVGWFLEDPEMFLVQTPHYFITPDPIEKNLKTFNRMPGESEMFYTKVQRGLDFWNASFFCGSAAVLRRSCLLEIGGLQEQTVTEDVETSVALHDRGYRSAYLCRPLVAGLQPESFASFIRQRMRWSQGMTQILMLKNPLLRKGMTLHQRLSYFNCAFFWLFAYARIIFLLAPCAYLLFGLQIFDANLGQVLAYALPHVIGVFLVSDFLFGRVRWLLASELYEVMQSLFTVSGIYRAFRRPHTPRFEVTPKGERLDKDSVSALARPFYLMFMLIGAAVIAGLYRLIYMPQEHDVTLVTLAWALFNLLIMLGAIGALVERRQRRSSPRVPANLPAVLNLGERRISCNVTGLSVSGASVEFHQESEWHLGGSTTARLELYNSALARQSNLPVRIAEDRDAKRKGVGLRLRVQFLPGDVSRLRDIVALVYGDSNRWRAELVARNRRVGMARGASFLVQVGYRHAILHLKFILRAVAVHLHGLGRGLGIKFGGAGSP